MPPPSNSKTSWEEVDKWYDAIVGDEGHYYHTHIVLPGVLRLLEAHKTSAFSLLDLACGQGVLARKLPPKAPYLGVDLSPSLIEKAKHYRTSTTQKFMVGDICQPLALNKEQLFSHATIILALQNVEFPDLVIKQASTYLQPGGTLVVVLNHPCYRIPRQSAWGIDDVQKIQYRKVNRYLTPLKVPIQMQPGKGEKSATTWSFHFPLSAYSCFLSEAGFSITLMEEWTSDKLSTGKNAKRENLARAEFPLFLAIKAKKN